MIEKVEGIILNTHDYSESSKILHIITKEHGILSVMAKGCRRMKSPFRSVCDKLIYGYFYIFYKPDKISNLNNVDVIDSWRNLKTDITKISYAGFLCELAEQVMKHHENEDVYTLLKTGLNKMNAGLDPMAITNILELKYLDYLGVSPVLTGCAICGKKTNIVSLSSYSGGYVCANCRRNEKIVSVKTIKLIRMYYVVDLDSISKLDISDISKREINQFLDEYYDRYTGLYLKSKTFLQNLTNCNFSIS